MRHRTLVDQLNPPQGQAVLHDQGPVLVLAGAGSGKTRVITFRIARLLADGVAADRICAVTFTNKAAREMRERLTRMVGRKATHVALSTFHSLGMSILREEHEAAGLRRGFCIYDTSDQLGLIRELMRQTKVAERRLDPQRLLTMLLDAKRAGLTEIRMRFHDEYEDAAYALYPKYLAQMRAFNAVDFDDLILRAQQVLHMPEPAERWESRFEHLLVDEYQDTSPDQLALLQTLGRRARSVCVVGDDDQSIYSWRGAAADSILSFAKHFEGATEIILDQNYRSTNHILNAANSVIAHNKVRKEKKLWSASGNGEPVTVVACVDTDDEVTFVVGKILELIREGIAAEDIAILYRANVQSRLFEEALALEKIPFTVIGGQAFYERKEVRDAHAILTIAVNPRDEIALRRIVNVPPRGIGPGSLDRLTAFAESAGKGLWWALQHADQVPGMSTAALAGARDLTSKVNDAAKAFGQGTSGQLMETATRLFDALGLKDSILGADDAPALSERRLENLDEVMNGLRRFEHNYPNSPDPLVDYLASSALASRKKDKEAEENGSVTLMTLHGAKGLEFKCVFFVGLEEGLLPHKRSVEAGGEIAEERRLCYVGMTRARECLWLTWCRVRLHRGKPIRRTPSRFLQELPQGDGVVQRDRSEPLTGDEGKRVADDFFAKMRAQLGEDFQADEA